MGSENLLTQRDRETETAGGFFCEACLAEKPLANKSPDPRYCQGCYEFLKTEWQRQLIIAATRKIKPPAWVPIDQPTEAADTVVLPLEDNKAACNGNNTPIALGGEVVTDNLRLCEVCGAALTGKRSDQRYCGNNCRVVAHRREKQGVLI